jgi:branched-chain amino acid transport system ATP-binding protein/urea transport system ATP-binding protein
MSAPLLQTRGLTMRFGGVVAVDRVDSALQEAELRCVIGPNGAGKSTFFKCLTGQLRPSAGEMLFRSADRRHRQPRHRPPGSRHQDPGAQRVRRLTARDNVWTAAARVAPGRIAERRTDAAMGGPASPASPAASSASSPTASASSSSSPW